MYLSYDQEMSHKVESVLRDPISGLCIGVAPDHWNTKPTEEETL